MKDTRCLEIRIDTELMPVDEAQAKALRWVADKIELGEGIEYCGTIRDENGAPVGSVEYVTETI